MGAEPPRRFLVTVDVSETSLKAAGYAWSLAGRLKARLSVLHAIHLSLGASEATLQVIRK